MSVSIRPETQELIKQRLGRGGYSTPDDLVRAALETLDQQQRTSMVDAAELELLYPGVRAKLNEGLAAAAAGKVVDGDEFFDALEDAEQDGDQGRKTA